MSQNRTILLRLAFPALLFAHAALAQNAVPVGKGSYADAAPGNVAKIENQQLYLLDQKDRPIPTNKWWTQLVVAPFAKSLWTYPLKLETGPSGVDLFFPTRWPAAGNDPISEFPLTISGQDFHPAAARAKDWSDWLVQFRMDESADKYVDVTIGEGMPCAWFEYHGVQPTIAFGKPNEKTPVTFFDANGGPLTLPATASAIGVTYHDRSFAIFAPEGTKFDIAGNGLSVAFTGDKTYLVACPLNDPKDIATVQKYAYAIPRDTKLSYTYDPDKAQVATTWTVTTDALQGDNHDVLQGWLPHHYSKTSSDTKFLDMTYLSPRGPLKIAAGHAFNITYPFTGLIPVLPPPKKDAGPNPYDPARMHDYFSQVAAKKDYGADTYWGGKDVLRYGVTALMAQQLGDDTYNDLLQNNHESMTNWFTYSAGEKDHYFAYYPKFRSLVGIKTSYGSEGFNDHHFHYGYFTYASACLIQNDPQFATDYGEMAKLVAKDYANWDRDDKRFPLFRTFDIWAGHSWAGGTGSPGGQNQESSSEAAQSWAGLLYLGQAMGDKDMVAAGAMGYAMETRAILEYWFNESGLSFSKNWKHPVTGMVWSGGYNYGTYFSGDPAWIYAIQWLPTSPMLSYLFHDPAWSKKMYENMQKDFEEHDAREAAKKKRPGKPATIDTFGPALGNVMIGYQLQYDPIGACAELDRLWEKPGDKIVHNAGEFTVIYYQAHAMQTLGRVDWTCHTSIPTSMVYINDQTKTRTYVVWNPSTTTQAVNVYEGTKLIGHLTAAPQKTTAVNRLD